MEGGFELAKVRRTGVFLAAILCLCAVWILLIGGRNFVPDAQGQDSIYQCFPSDNPCLTCPQTLNTKQCLINLHGWVWGGCAGTPLFPCWERQATCAGLADCQIPPNPLPGPDCSVEYWLCTS